MAMKRAIFLDRDGVINQLISDVYVNEWKDFRFCERVFETFAILRLTKFKVVIISNQAGIDLGYAEYSVVQGIFNKMLESIIDNTDFPADRLSYYFCPHKPESLCACRKPAPGMIYRAAVEQEITIHNSWLIGDSDTDLMAGLYGGLHPSGVMKIETIQNVSEPPAIQVQFPTGAVLLRPRKYNSLYEAVMDIMMMDVKFLTITGRSGRLASVSDKMPSSDSLGFTKV